MYRNGIGEGSSSVFSHSRSSPFWISGIFEMQNEFNQISHNLIFQENVGWGLRTVSDKNFHDFKILYEFFHPHAAFFQLLYRLLLDTNKYEIKLSELPTRLRQMLEAGRYSSFYTNILNVDNFQPRNFSLSLSKFFKLFSFSSLYFDVFIICQMLSTITCFTFAFMV